MIAFDPKKSYTICYDFASNFVRKWVANLFLLNLRDLTNQFDWKRLDFVWEFNWKIFNGPFLLQNQHNEICMYLWSGIWREYAEFKDPLTYDDSNTIFARFFLLRSHFQTRSRKLLTGWGPKRGGKFPKGRKFSLQKFWFFLALQSCFP